MLSNLFKKATEISVKEIITTRPGINEKLLNNSTLRKIDVSLVVSPEEANLNSSAFRQGSKSVSNVKILATDINHNGLLNPIVVKRDGDKGKDRFICASGNHRAAAVKTLGWKHIEAYVLDDDVSEEFFMQIGKLENIHLGLSVSVMQRNNQIVDMLDEGYTVKVVAGLFGVATQTVSNARKKVGRLKEKTAGKQGAFASVSEQFPQNPLTGAEALAAMLARVKEDAGIPGNAKYKKDGVAGGVFQWKDPVTNKTKYHLAFVSVTNNLGRVSSTIDDRLYDFCNEKSVKRYKEYATRDDITFSMYYYYTEFKDANYQLVNRLTERDYIIEKYKSFGKPLTMLNYTPEAMVTNTVKFAVKEVEKDL